MKNVFKHLEGGLRAINSYSFPFSKRAMLFLEIDRKWRLVITSCARDEEQERERAL